jgi:release factor glutamine methyltransferase
LGLVTARERVAGSGLPPGEARALLALVLGVARERLIAHPDMTIPAESAARFERLADRRRRGEPLAYLRGEQEFYGRPFRVGPQVLIPRPDTETLVEVALACLHDRRAARVLELGTGSGCIAVTVQLERPDVAVTATDVSPSALDVARWNAQQLGANVEFRTGNWFDAVTASAPFDLIVSNPPYVAAGDPHLGDLAHEPALALTDGADGLRCLITIIGAARQYLFEGGWLALEHGYDQAQAVAELLATAGLREVEVIRDAAGHERVTRARR